MSAATTLSNRFRALRKQAGLTQVDLAVRLGISRAYLAKIETSGDQPGREVLLAAANFFKVSLDWLAHGRGDMRPARAMDEREAMLLRAFRAMPPGESDLLLRLLLSRLSDDDI